MFPDSVFSTVSSYVEKLDLKPMISSSVISEPFCENSHSDMRVFRKIDIRVHCRNRYVKILTFLSQLRRDFFRSLPLQRLFVRCRYRLFVSVNRDKRFHCIQFVGKTKSVLSLFPTETVNSLR